jgi:outer membrane immunogenic protein
MMNMKLGSAIAVALACSGAAAYGADLPSKKAPPPVVYAPPPPVFTWTGLYGGLNLGGGFSGENGIQQSLRIENYVPTPISEIFQLRGPALSGILGGAQFGYNWQVTPMFVLGLETDFQGSGIAGHSHQIQPPIVFPGKNFALAATGSHRLDYFGTVRGRLGFLPTPTLMVYATGGLAYGHMRYGFKLLDSDLDILEGYSSHMRTGWTAGGGVEWAFLPNWSAKLEYLYTDLGSAPNVNLPEITPGMLDQPNVFKTINVTPTRFSTIRAGVNYHFNLFNPAPVVSKY